MYNDYPKLEIWKNLFYYLQICTTSPSHFMTLSKHSPHVRNDFSDDKLMNEWCVASRKIMFLFKCDVFWNKINLYIFFSTLKTDWTWKCVSFRVEKIEIRSIFCYLIFLFLLWWELSKKKNHQLIFSPFMNFLPVFSIYTLHSFNK